MLIQVTDLCGGEAPYQIDYSDIDAPTREILAELMDDNESPWFIGEFEYRELELSVESELPGAG